MVLRMGEDEEKFIAPVFLACFGEFLRHQILEMVDPIAQEDGMARKKIVAVGVVFRGPLICSHADNTNLDKIPG